MLLKITCLSYVRLEGNIYDNVVNHGITLCKLCRDNSVYYIKELHSLGNDISSIKNDMNYLTREQKTLLTVYEKCATVCYCHNLCEMGLLVTEIGLAIAPGFEELTILQKKLQIQCHNKEQTEMTMIKILSPSQIRILGQFKCNTYEEREITLVILLKYCKIR